MRTRSDNTHPGSSDAPGESIGELLSQLASESAGLVSDELALAKEEMREKVAVLSSGLLVVGIGAGIGVVALASVSAAAVIWLSERIGGWQAALIVGVSLAVVAALTGLAGIRQVRRMGLQPK